jgi:hypothetical protein
MVELAGFFRDGGPWHGLLMLLLDPRREFTKPNGYFWRLWRSSSDPRFKFPPDYV